MADADYTKQLDDLLAEIKSLNTKVDALQAGVDGGAKDATLTDMIVTKLDVMDTSLKSIAEKETPVETVDYTQDFGQVKELIVYTDMVLIVLVVVVVVLSGAVFGHEILSRLKVH